MYGKNRPSPKGGAARCSLRFANLFSFCHGNRIRCPIPLANLSASRVRVNPLSGHVESSYDTRNAIQRNPLHPISQQPLTTKKARGGVDSRLQKEMSTRVCSTKLGRMYTIPELLKRFAKEKFNKKICEAWNASICLSVDRLTR